MNFLVITIGDVAACLCAVSAPFIIYFLQRRDSEAPRFRCVFELSNTRIDHAPKEFVQGKPSGFQNPLAHVTGDGEPQSYLYMVINSLSSRGFFIRRISLADRSGSFHHVLQDKSFLFDSNGQFTTELTRTDIQKFEIPRFPSRSLRIKIDIQGRSSFFIRVPSKYAKFILQHLP